jgi:hypothetical protein
MFTRRKFLKVFGLTSLAFSFLPSFLINKSFSASLKDTDEVSPVRNWLYGSPRRGCSTPSVALDYHDKAEDGLRDFVGIRIPSRFTSLISYEQYLS